MRRKVAGGPVAEPSSHDGQREVRSRGDEDKSRTSSPFLLLGLFVVLIHASWLVHRSQFVSLPLPLDADKAGKRGFSELSALEHARNLTDLGPHPVGSDALDRAVRYVLAAAEKIKESSHWEVDVEVDHFVSKPGFNRPARGLFKGRTLVYSSLQHVVIRVSPKYSTDAVDNAILVSSHIDTVFSTEGAGDCTSCISVMLELARGVSQWAHGFNHAVIFLFNTGEEEGLNGAHSFVTQHPWIGTIRFAVDLEAMGIGGKSSIFQSGPDSWGIENFAAVAKYPSGQIISQDIFNSGIIKSATDFQVYKEVAGLSGLDFVYGDYTAVYHTKATLRLRRAVVEVVRRRDCVKRMARNDKMELLKAGSLQHLGENMLVFLQKGATSPSLPKLRGGQAEEEKNKNQSIFFDILGSFMVVCSQKFTTMFYNSLIVQTLLLWIASLFMGGTSAVKSLLLSYLSTLLMWIFSLGLSIMVAFLLPLVCSSPLPYAAHPWLVLGLFGPPATIGALIGQHLGYLILQKYWRKVYSVRYPQLSSVTQVELVKWEAQRWLYKAGFCQWFVLLMIGNYFKIGSSHVALVWLVSPAFAYGLIEATLSPVRLPKQLKVVTLVLGMGAPVLISAGVVVRLLGTLIGILVRFDRDPGGTPEWLGSVVIGSCVAAVVCLMFVYLLCYVHPSGGKKHIIVVNMALFALALASVASNILPPFTNDVARAVNVVHVVEAQSKPNVNRNPVSYVSLSSLTPGNLINEVKGLKDEGFVCGRERSIDLVTFKIIYGCVSFGNTEEGWSESDIPTIHVESDTKESGRVSEVSIDTKLSTRWFLTINTKEIQKFKLEGNSQVLVPVSDNTDVDGWHSIQYSGGKDSPRKFTLTLFWFQNRTHWAQGVAEPKLLKLRTDLNRVTPKVARTLEKLPSWCSLFGKSTSPFTLSFLNSLEVDF